MLLMLPQRLTMLGRKYASCLVASSQQSHAAGTDFWWTRTVEMAMPKARIHFCLRAAIDFGQHAE
jgi:hypothetical protein